MSNSKLKIAISLRVIEEKNYHEKRDGISQDWIIFTNKIGIIPILIPNQIENLENFLKELQINGIILSGGDNIGDNTERDDTEEKLINFGIENKIPIIGICRGMQVLNYFFKGKIEKNDSSNHVSTRHIVEIIQENFQKILGNEVQVNSYHNNIITKTGLALDLKPFAISSDGTVEGFFHKKLPILGVMWHPERERDSINESILKTVFQNKKFFSE